MSFKRYKTWQEVPLFKFAVFPNNHPDLEVIIQAYEIAGVGLGIDYNV